MRVALFSPVRPVRVSWLVPAILSLAVGCAPEKLDPKLLAALEEVRSGRSDTIDATKLPEMTDKELARVKDLPNLKMLILDDCLITDEGLKKLARLPKLINLSLSNTNISGEGLEPVTKANNLVGLRLDGTRIKDADLAAIAAMPGLKNLSLYKCAISDEGVRHLAKHGRLGNLSLDETQVTDASLKILAGCPQLVPRLGLEDGRDRRRDRGTSPGPSTARNQSLIRIPKIYCTAQIANHTVIQLLQLLSALCNANFLPGNRMRGRETNFALKRITRWTLRPRISEVGRADLAVALIVAQGPQRLPAPGFRRQESRGSRRS